MIRSSVRLITACGMCPPNVDARVAATAHPACSISPMPTTITPAAAILGAPKRSLKKRVPMAAPTMRDDAAGYEGEGHQLVPDVVGDRVPAGVGHRGRQYGGGHQRRHTVRSRTSARVPPAWAISDVGSSGNTVCGVPAAAHTTSWSSSPRSASTRVRVTCPKGGTPPIA